MNKTVFNTYEIEKSDYAKIYANHFIEELQYLRKTKIDVNYDTDHGFTASEKISQVTGLYLLYKEDELIYIGKSDRCMRTRIGRFIAGVRGTERFDENHSAAYKYNACYGRNVDDLYFKYIELNIDDLQHDLTLDDIEQQLIRSLSPRFNSEVYSKSKPLYVISYE